MKKLLLVLTLFGCLIGSAQTRFDVSSAAEFNEARDNATAGDSIVWESGTYSNVFMDIPKNGLIVTAEAPGSAIFNGASKVEIDGDDVTLSELQFIGGNIGTDHVIRIWGSDVLITQINIDAYTCYKYLIVDEDSRRTTISYSNFENRLNLDDQNILSILVDDNVPGYHKVQYCSFKNFEGTGNDLGIEPIRIGVSTQAEFDSRSIVEYCYFTNCDGDGELISNKASQNVIRYNTFENNSKAELVLRHGDEAIVYGNFFLNNMGGVRVREGSNHFIYNNYFEGLERRSIYLQNESSDPLSDIHVFFNTIINSAEMILGGDGGSNPPTNVTIANNIFADPTEQLFEEPTNDETWLGNISKGTLGITSPSGITSTDPSLVENGDGFYQISETSPAIDNAVAGYPSIPLFEGLDYDTEIFLDLMIQDRPEQIASKDVGAVEFSSNLNVTPHATEENTGPSYLTSISGFTVTLLEVGNGTIILDPAQPAYESGTTVTVTAFPDAGNEFLIWSGALTGTENPQSFTITDNIEIGAVFTESVLSVEELEDVLIYPNPSTDDLVVEWSSNGYDSVTFEILSMSGKVIKRLSLTRSQSSTTSIDVSELPAGTYILKCGFQSKEGASPTSHLVKFIKN